jgi:KDO2-lipid IV(A) lauroyltransferase
MAKKQRSAVVDYAVYLAVRLVVCLVQALPEGVAAAVGRLAGRLAYWVDRRHRQVAHDNLRQAFPEWSDDHRDQVVRRVYRHFGLLLIEIMRTPRVLHLHNWNRYIRLINGDLQLDRLLDSRPLLILTGHFGNWELAGYLLNMIGFRTCAIARPLDNPYLDDFLRRFREKTGQRILAKNGEYELIEGELLAGGVVATLADQDAGARGMFVDFFGRPASTHKAVALMAIRYNVPILVAGAIRTGGLLHYDIVGEDVIYPEEYADRPDGVRAITERFTLALERLVRRAPEQYLWLHRRWKHEPPKRKSKARAA